MGTLAQCKESYSTPRYIANNLWVQGRQFEIIRDIDFSGVTNARAELFRRLTIVKNCILPKVSLYFSNLLSINQSDFRKVTNFPRKTFKQISSLYRVSLPSVDVSGVVFEGIEVYETNFLLCKNFTWREFATLPKECFGCSFPNIGLSENSLRFPISVMSDRYFYKCDLSGINDLSIEMIDVCRDMVYCTLGVGVIQRYASDIGAIKRLLELKPFVRAGNIILPLHDYIRQHPTTHTLKKISLSYI